MSDPIDNSVSRPSPSYFSNTALLRPRRPRTGTPLIGFLPLVKAVARVIGAERNAAGGCDGAAQLAELQTLSRIIAVAAQVVQKGRTTEDTRPVNGLLQEFVARRAAMRRAMRPGKRGWEELGDANVDGRVEKRTRSGVEACV
ncbi:hypothetical protein LTR60_002246 [Cryomyces antarcticus]|nr:hypothetical protein LTR39_002301 [Cryomyces antarcticus]KAK5016772.1 hypothetical protein LTR60_002246 [Cryomyces antarcticus]